MGWNRRVAPLLRNILRTAVDGWIDHALRGGRADTDLTAGERKRARSSREMAGRIRKISRLAGRFLR